MIQRLEGLARKQARVVLERAHTLSEDRLQRCREHFPAELAALGIPVDAVCFAVPGSIGRREALEASDCDLIAIVDEQSTQVLTKDAFKQIGKSLSEKLGGIEVSRGRSVMGVVPLGELLNEAAIGGDKDDRIALTRRIVTLTEAAHAGGQLELRDVRKRMLSAYTRRASGSHPLAFCNDLARYYRQLSMDYKAKHGIQVEEWAEYNVKLRHSRKFWYFSTMLAAATIATRNHSESDELVQELLTMFDQSPVQRLIWALPSPNAALGELLEHYAWYLQFMSDSARREELAKVPHSERYTRGPYASLQWNSKVIHGLMLDILNEVGPGVRKRVLDWFLL